MPRLSGTPKTGGRKKGTPNRSSLELSDHLSSLGLDVPAEIVKALPALEAEARVRTLMELMNFLFPKRKAVEVSSVQKMHDEASFQIEFVEADNGKPSGVTKTITLRPEK